MAIFTHVTVGTNDLAKARLFYDGVLAPLGYKRLNDLGENGSIWGESAPEFFVLKPANGNHATIANGGTISFRAPNRAAVAAFHKAALAAGGVAASRPSSRLSVSPRRDRRPRRDHVGR